MKIKSILTIVLLVFVAASFVFLIIRATGSKSDAGISDEKAQAIGPQPAHQIVVYYFHRTQRCPTCLKIEELSHSVVAEKFANELKDRKLVWRVINVEDPGNEHFETDYNLVSQSLIVAEMRDGKQVEWKNLDQIWELVWKEPEFRQYVETEIRPFLEKS